MNTTHFKNLPQHLCSYLSKATSNIRAAVCWFSHRDIFEVLLDRLRSGIKVELMLEYDSQNIRDGGLDFQQFVRTGGQLWAHREAGLMHHKFALVDDRMLLTGSFNWTYNSNAENLMTTSDPTTVAAFKEEFECQKAAAQPVFKVCSTDVKVFSAFPLFEKTHFPLTDLRKKVSRGVAVWMVRLDKLKIDRIGAYSKNLLSFDAAHILAPYWTAYRIWDDEIFDEEMVRVEPTLPGYLLRNLRCWARRMKIGDVIFDVGLNVAQANVEGSSRNSIPAYLLAIGIIQSHPQRFSGEGFSSFRSVQWLKILEEKPYLMPEKTSGQSVAKYRGSALRVLQEVFG